MLFHYKYKISLMGPFPQFPLQFYQYNLVKMNIWAAVIICIKSQAPGPKDSQWQQVLHGIKGHRRFPHLHPLETPVRKEPSIASEIHHGKSFFKCIGVERIYSLFQMVFIIFIIRKHSFKFFSNHRVGSCRGRVKVNQALCQCDQQPLRIRSCQMKTRQG